VILKIIKVPLKMFSKILKNDTFNHVANKHCGTKSSVKHFLSKLSKG
jgi:hypothetical protein